MHTHTHTDICLSVCAARDPGQREVCGRWPEENEAGATCLTDKTYTHSHRHAHKLQVINDNGKPVRNRFEPKQMVDQQ